MSERECAYVRVYVPLQKKKKKEREVVTSGSSGKGGWGNKDCLLSVSVCLSHYFSLCLSAAVSPTHPPPTHTHTHTHTHTPSLGFEPILLLPAPRSLYKGFKSIENVTLAWSLKKLRLLHYYSHY